MDRLRPPKPIPVPKNARGHLDSMPLALPPSRFLPLANTPEPARSRSHGVQGSNVDFLICAAAYSYRTAIFTTDNDFRHFARHLPIKLYEP